MYSYSHVPKPCPPVPIAVANPSLALLFDVGCCRLELARMNVDTWPTADVRVSSLGVLAGKSHATGTHQASLQANLSLALPISSFAFSLYSARFSLRWAFRSWCAFSSSASFLLAPSFSSGVRALLLPVTVPPVLPNPDGTPTVDEEVQAPPVEQELAQVPVAAQDMQSRLSVVAVDLGGELRPGFTGQIFRLRLVPGLLLLSMRFSLLVGLLPNFSFLR